MSPPFFPSRSPLLRAWLRLAVLLAVSAALPAAAQVPTPEWTTVARAPGARLYGPSAAFTADGAVLVLWEHSADGIQARRLGAGGRLAEPRVLVPNDLPRAIPYEGPATLQRDPVVVPLDGGEFLAIWKEERQRVRIDVLMSESELVASTIRVRRFDGAARPLGRAVAVSGASRGFEIAPRAVRLADGRVLVVWRTERNDQPLGIFGRFLGGRGMPQGEVFRIDAPGPAQALRPVLVPVPEGGFFVAWQTCCDPEGAPDVVARRFGSSGEALGEPFGLAQERAGEQHWPALALGRNGELMAAWMAEGAGGEVGRDYRIHGQRLALDGSFLGPELVLSSGVGFAHGAPTLAPLPDGFALVWTLWRTHFLDDVYGVALDPAGVPRGPGTRISADTPGFQWELALDTDAGGRVLVGWRGSDADGHSAVQLWTQRPGGYRGP